jgi:dienelactone hydrolase
MPTITLPRPTGPYPVGRRLIDVVDPDRLDPYARRRATPRKLSVAVWYPAAAGTGAPCAYLPGAWRTVGWTWGLGARRVRTHARAGAASAGDDRFPLIVFSPSANPALCYTALLEDLASHGYVVAGISHTYESMPVTAFASGWPRLVRLASLGGGLSRPGSRPYADDLRDRRAVVEVKAADIELVARAMAAGAAGPDIVVDPARRAVVGHSFGGGAGALLSASPGWRAAVSMDGGLWTAPEAVRPGAPVLQLFGEHPEFRGPVDELVERGQYVDADYASEDRATTVAAWQRLHHGHEASLSALVPGATHTSFCDWPMLPIRSWSPARRALGGVRGDRVWRLASSATRTFLDHHVLGGPVDVSAALTGAGLDVAAPADLFGPGDPRATPVPVAAQSS